MFIFCFVVFLTSAFTPLKNFYEEMRDIGMNEFGRKLLKE